MNSFESVVKFTEVVLETARTLKRLGFKDYKRYPLPSLEELNNIKNRLDDIQPIYISASILGDANRDKNKHYYYEHLRPYLMIYPAFCEGAIVIDGEYHNIINGFDFKLRDKSDEDQTKYYEIVWSINNKLYDILKGMNRDMNYIFGEPVVDWSVYEHSGFEDSPEDNQSINPSSHAKDLPKELDTPEIRAYLDKAIQIGLLYDYFTLKGSKMLLACFCWGICKQYNISTKAKSGKNKGGFASNWSLFNFIKDVNGKTIDLRQAWQNAKNKYGIKFNPSKLVSFPFWESLIKGLKDNE